MLSTLLLAALLAFCGFWIQMQQRKLDRLRKDLRRYESLTSREERERQLDSNIIALERQQEFLNNQINNLQNESRELDAKVYLQAIDYYEPKFSFIKSTEYVIHLKNIKLDQERMRKAGKAFISNVELSLNGSQRKGEKMKKSLLNLIKEAFETQCDYAIREVKYNNVPSLEKRITNSFKKLNKLSEVTRCEISQEYLNLKVKELYLKYELEEKQQEEKQKEREIREQMKQEEKERLNFEKAMREAEEAEQIEKQYEEDIEKVRREMEQAVGTQLDDYNRQIKYLQEQLSKAKTDKEKANSDLTRLKAGYIYVLSNIGSLGRDIYRIFMTKSSKPDVYVRTMNPSVPFPFDVHFKLFSEDASETVEYLHQQFNDKRMNIANEKREFFKVRLDEIEQVVQKIYRETGALTIEKFEKVPQALEYRRTQAAERRSDYHTTLTDAYVEEEGEIA
jgi:type II secretory pathway pseudopilin PulG